MWGGIIRLYLYKEDSIGQTSIFAYKEFPDTLTLDSMKRIPILKFE